MPNKKITQLPPSATPLTGAEILPVVQSSATVQTSVNSLGSGIGYTPTGTGAVATTVQTKLRELISVKDFGAVGDGVADDTTAVTNVQAATSRAYLPPGTYSTTLAQNAIRGKFWGTGQVKDLAGNLRAPFMAAPNAPPSSTGSEGSILTAFNGDLTKCQFPVEHSITGATTAGQPTTGYLYTPEIYPHYTYLFNTSGWNQNTNSNVGRTAVCAYRTKVDNYGQGDAMAYNATAFVTGTKAGSTDFLANPAAVLFAGDLNAGADGVYLNPYETIASDSGYDVGCFGIVNNFNRTNATGAKSAVWGGYRAQNIGAASCDAMFSATGKWVTGLDFSMATLDFGASLAAVSLKAGQRIYFNNTALASGTLDANYRTTVFNNDYIHYSGSSIIIVAGNSPSLQIGPTVVISPVNFNANATFRHQGTLFGVFSATPVGQLTGWGIPTGNFVVTNFPGASATLAQCSQTIAQMIVYMKQLGFYGA
jgi:hypothetical protein